MQEKELQVWHWAQQREGSASRGCSRGRWAVTILSPWIQLGRTLGFGWQQLRDAECSSESLERLGNAGILPVQCLYRGDLHASLPRVPFLLPTQAGMVGAGQQQCHPSLSCTWTVNVHSFFMGQKPPWLQLREGLSWHRKTSTGRCSGDNTAAALNFTPWSLICGIFF